MRVSDLYHFAQRPGSSREVRSSEIENAHSVRRNCGFELPRPCLVGQPDLDKTCPRHPRRVVVPVALRVVHDHLGQRLMAGG
jgi:hypothetical protein